VADEANTANAQKWRTAVLAMIETLAQRAQGRL
jgi:hypothetical protein